MIKSSEKNLVQYVKMLIFLLLFTDLFLNITYILRRDSDTKQRFAGFYAEMQNSIDMVYIGSSPVHPYWAAPLAWNEHGFTSYPLATNMQQPKAALPLLKEAIKFQKPKVVIFELRMFTAKQSNFEDDDSAGAFVRNITDNMKFSRNRNHLIRDMKTEGNNKINYYFDIAIYHTFWKKLKESDWKYYNFSKADPNRGHFIVGSVIDLSKKYHNYNYVTEGSAIPSEQEYFLIEILNYCKKNNINALFTINPYTDITEETQTKFNYMKELITKQSEYPVINFNLLYDELGIDFNKDFYNGGHMNILGAEKFTKYLGNYLVEHYNLPDKRSDKAYESWNKSYDSWRIKADEAINTIEEKIREGKYDE